MNTALLLHGWWWSSEGSWFPWLQKELNRKFLDVYTPNLPNTNYPVLEEQEEYINIYASDFKDGGYIIAHSLWCQLAIKFIEENNIKNSIVILVAPSYPWLSWELGKDVFGDSYDTLNTYYNTKINFQKINTLQNQYHIFLSDNDPFINWEHAKKYYSQLQKIEFKEFKNKGHFNTSAWVLELPEILDYILPNNIWNDLFIDN